ncbi:MAG TPA: hypothetical protein VF933_19055 [Streptosporangiaceae bacterium]
MARRGQAALATSRKARFVVNTGRDARRTAGHTPAKGGRVRSIAMIVIVYVAAPVAAYSLLRSAGMTAVTALLLSGVLPALGVSRCCR